MGIEVENNGPTLSKPLIWKDLVTQVSRDRELRVEVHKSRTILRLSYPAPSSLDEM